MSIQLKRFTALVFVAGIATACGCHGWHYQVKPLKHPLAKEDPNVVPPENAYGYLQNGPVFEGDHVVPPPPPTATEEAALLRSEVEQLSASQAELQARMDALREVVDLKQSELQVARDQLRHAHQELAGAHTRLESWRQDVHTMRDRLKAHEQEQSAAIDEAVTSLSDFVQRYESSSSEQAAETSDP